MNSAGAETVAEALHELRGPLGAVLMGVELGLRLGGLCTRRLQALEQELGRAAQALDDLERCLARARTEAPGGSAASVVAGRGPVELRCLLEDSLEAWRAVAAGRRLVLESPGAGDALWVRGERLRLAQATGNLLANAIEHGAGTVRVRARAARDTVRVEVGDEGPGLPAPLSQLLESERHGLSVVAAVAAAHGGRLLSAPTRRGARLVIELPRVEPGALGAVAGCR